MTTRAPAVLTNYFGKMNSTLGSVVPLAMFVQKSIGKFIRNIQNILAGWQHLSSVISQASLELCKSFSDLMQTDHWPWQSATNLVIFLQKVLQSLLSVFWKLFLQYPAFSCNSVQLLAILCNNLQFRAIAFNFLQYLAEYCATSCNLVITCNYILLFASSRSWILFL